MTLTSGPVGSPSTLDMLSRWKGMETSQVLKYTEFSFLGFGYAFPLEGNGNSSYIKGILKNPIFGYAFPLEGNGNFSKIATSEIARDKIFGYAFPLEGNGNPYLS